MDETFSLWGCLVFERQGTSRKEHTSLWPIWVAIGFPFLLIAIEATPIATDFAYVIVGLPALLAMWTGVGVWAAILTVRRLSQRAWQLAAISAVLPLAILGVGFQLLPFIHFCNDAGDILRFLVMRPSYMKTISAATSNGEARLLVFNLGGMSWSSRGFVYDESDEVIRDPSLQTSGWKARAQNSELSCSGYYAQPFPGHFGFTRHWYLASFPC
jgi:hypothetical protein